MDADVIIVGAGPTGLMLAGELCLTGVRPLVLERLPQIRDIPKAGGLSGQILQLLHYRGELERFEAASTAPRPAPRFPFGGMHVDFTQLADPPMQALPLPQPRLERVLDELARELGAEIRRGQEVVGLSQDDATVTADVRGADGPHKMRARYLVGCDGARSRVRDMAGIPFPGTTYPEIQRLAVVTVPEAVTVLENGALDVAGVGRISFGFTRTERGEFAVGSTNPALMGLFTSEDEPADYDDDEPMTLTELRDSIRRVLGVDLPLGEPTRLTRFTFHARQVERYRDGRILLAGDAAHLFPAPGVALNAGLLDSFAPDLTLRTDRGATSVAELMHAARPILLDLADRPDLRETAQDWEHRIEVHTAETDRRPADALLIRPDAHIAWAATIDEPTDTAAPALREALSGWFGTPLKATA